MKNVITFVGLCLIISYVLYRRHNPVASGKDLKKIELPQIDRKLVWTIIDATVYFLLAAKLTGVL